MGPHLDIFLPEKLCSPLTHVNHSTQASTEQGFPPVDDTTPHVVRQFPISVYELIKDSFKGMVMMVCEDETPPVKPGQEPSNPMEQLVKGSGSQVPWAPGALDPPLPDYVIRYQQRSLDVESSDATHEPEASASAITAQGAATDNDAVSFQRKILPIAAEIHPDKVHADDGVTPNQSQVSERSGSQLPSREYLV
jgi:hypothetical protein